MATIHALLVGINAYPTAPLSGCINDVTAWEIYLKKMYASDNPAAASLRIQRITDEDSITPTRQNIIGGFDFFRQAKDDDICLFYYSGHGSFTSAPEEFWTERDGCLESFVCIDSRLPGGRDLTNKEMGYLISKAMEGKPGVQFIAITDCCHSGTITKAIQENNWTDRSVAARFIPAKLEDFLGYGKTINGTPAYSITTVDGKQKVTVQQTNHIHLAASQANQTAKELNIDGRQHGAFTSALLKNLYTNRGLISYQKLVAAATIQVANLVMNQAPVLNINGALSEAEAKKYFLLGESDSSTPSYKVYWNNKAGWCIAAGPVHGASIGDTVIIKDVCETKIIDQTAPDFSVLLSKPQLGTKDKVYNGELVLQPAVKLKAGFGEDVPDGLKQMLLAAYKKLNPVYLDLSDVQPKFFIHRSDKGIFIARAGSQLPIFDYSEVNNENDADEFFRKIGAVASWLHLLELANPASTLTDKDYEITIRRKVANGDLAFESVEDITKPIELWYQFDGTKWEHPAMELTILNKSGADLWINCLYMGVDYSVNGTALKEIRLPAGKSTPLTVINGRQQESPVLKFEIAAELQAKGYDDITEYFKLFISSDRIDTSFFSQDALKLASIPKDPFDGTKTKGLVTGETGEAKNEWRTETISLHIVRPKEVTRLEEGQTTLNGVRIEGPKNFSASVALVSSEQSVEGTRSSGAYMPGKLGALQSFSLVAKTGSSAPVDMIELTDVENPEVITRETSLKIQLPVTRDASMGTVIPLALDASTGLYYPVGFVDVNNQVQIERLPLPTPTSGAITTKSLTGSIKIYFKKVVGKWFGGSRDFSRLAEPYLKDGEIEYRDDKSAKSGEKLIERVAAAQNILLVIHGIIGDTRGMAESLYTVLDDQGTTPGKGIDLTLSFDYENLGTSIKTTAQDLKNKLAAIGLKEGHGKHLVIVAHSMGGLVSRWFIEQLGGNKVVSHLVMYGTPNNGTPWADVRDMAQAIITYGINGAAFLQPWLFILSGIGKIAGGAQLTLKEMDPDTGIYQTLNTGKVDPGILYTVVSGNTQEIIPGYQKTASLISRIFSKGKIAAYKALDQALFKKPNDIAASVESIHTLPGSGTWVIKPKPHLVACDHLSYFSMKEALGYLNGYQPKGEKSITAG